MRIKSVSHVGITVSDFDKAVKWYNEIFGFKLINVQVLDKATVKALFPLYAVNDSTVKLGFLRAPKGQVIEIFEFSNKGTSDHYVWNEPGLSHFTLDVKKVKKWYETYKERVDFVIEPQVTDGNHWVFLRDPDGNLIELIDLKMNYYVIRLLGGLAGSVMKKTTYQTYYEER